MVEGTGFGIHVGSHGNGTVEMPAVSRSYFLFSQKPGARVANEHRRWKMSKEGERGRGRATEKEKRKTGREWKLFSVFTVETLSLADFSSSPFSTVYREQWAPVLPEKKANFLSPGCIQLLQISTQETLCFEFSFSISPSLLPRRQREVNTSEKIKSNMKIMKTQNQGGLHRYAVLRLCSQRNGFPVHWNTDTNVFCYSVRCMSFPVIIAKGMRLHASGEVRDPQEVVRAEGSLGAVQA